MIKKISAAKILKAARLVFGISDILAGLGSLIFLAVLTSVVPGLRETPFLSSVFLISLAVPLLIVIMGITTLVRTKTNSAISVFGSFLVGVNSLASLFSREAPFFLSTEASAATLQFFHSTVPLAAIVYFSLHALIGLLALREAKNELPEVPGERPLEHPEFFCAVCRHRLRPSDGVCPSCGALIKGVQCGSCGFEGSSAEFVDDRCPRCGNAQDQKPEA